MSRAEVVANELKKMDPQSRIIFEILLERERQDAKFGPNRDQTELEWGNVLTEEVGESAQAVNDVWFALKEGKITKPTYLKHLKEQYRPELIQVAAVAIAALEDFDRKVKDL